MYKRVLLKLSGEALSGAIGTGIDPATVDKVVCQLVELAGRGVQIAIVVGGGNFWRGRQGVAMDKVTADHMGMLATIMNALRKALRHFECGRIVIFACGTGNPYFTTDSGAALRAAEIKADVLLMAKNVDGVYDCDPKTNKNAKKLCELSYMDVLNKNIAVMDFTSVTMCMENNIPIVAFGLNEKNSIIRAADGEKIGTLIH